MFELGGVTFHWYGLLIGVAVWVAMDIYLGSKSDVAKDIRERAAWWAVLGGVVGARTYHVIDYWGEYYAHKPEKILALWEGGLGILGALLGGLLAVSIFCSLYRIKLKKITDSMVGGIPLAQAIGRLGNRINGELEGRSGEPLYAYEAVLNFCLFMVLMFLRKKKTGAGFLTGTYLLGYSLIRIMLETLRPEELIWRLYNVPVAWIVCLIMGSAGVVLMVLSQKQR